MKRKLTRLFSIITIITCFAFASNAQEIGIRFGGTNGAGGAAIDGLFDVAQFSRVHVDLGFYSGGMGIDGLWDFLYRPIGAEAFSWYLGAGVSTFIGDKFQLGASGEIGAQYYFNSVPISLGVDWRPTLWLTNTRFRADSFGINVRYVFGK